MMEKISHRGSIYCFIFNRY